MLNNVQIVHNFSLKEYNTFGIEQIAEAFVSVEDELSLRSVLKDKTYSKKFILGGGSNLLLTKPLKGLCIHINTKGIRIVEENNDEIIIEAMAGENWHDFVMWSLDQGYGGLENLALIPGNTGTASIQNIGAYGVELKDVFHQCTALDIASDNEVHFSCQEVDFGYRTSLFKTSAKGKYVITKLQVRLTKRKHILNTAYGAIQTALNGETPSPKRIAEAVISIRKEKLPDPATLGNSGSFFKNPIVSNAQFEKIKIQFPNVPAYIINNEQVKIPAGWLIETIGFKGYRQGDAGVHKKQALVLVNYGNASGKDILVLAKLIQAKVFDSFSIALEAEVNIL